MKTMVFAGVLTAALLNAGPATAGVITIDFEDHVQVPFVFGNLVTKGFQFSPNFHYQIVGPTVGEPIVHNYPSRWLGWDRRAPKFSPASI